MTIYVITRTTGSYSDTSWYVLGYTDSQEQAKSIVAQMEALYDKLRVERERRRVVENKQIHEPMNYFRYTPGAGSTPNDVATAYVEYMNARKIRYNEYFATCGYPPESTDLNDEFNSKYPLADIGHFTDENSFDWQEVGRL